MNIEKQKQIIAEFEGWKEKLSWKMTGGLLQKFRYQRNDERRWELPSYPTDENEIRRVWRGLPRQLKMKALIKLSEILNTGFKEYWSNVEKVSDATAPQLCEALVKSFGEWEEQ